MKFLNLLLDGANSAGENLVNSAYETFKTVVSWVMPVIIGVVGLFAIIYAVILGVKYAKAEDTEKREEAKKHLVAAVIGVVVALVFVLIIWAVLNSGALESLFTVK
ncbi:MAG: hypothetical protein IJT25_03335 [Clostridia bacterium]|nr:hypothetical protein [Clostridia bacterium]